MIKNNDYNMLRLPINVLTERNSYKYTFFFPKFLLYMELFLFFGNTYGLSALELTFFFFFSFIGFMLKRQSLSSLSLSFVKICLLVFKIVI